MLLQRIIMLRYTQQKRDIDPICWINQRVVSVETVAQHCVDVFCLLGSKRPFIKVIGYKHPSHYNINP